VRRAKEGDVDAYAVLLRAHEAAARRLAAVVSGIGDADEVAQDAFVKAWGGLGSFRPSAPFRPWLLRIVANEARNCRRAAGRRSAIERRAGEERLRADAAPSPEAALLAAGEREALLAAIERLPERDRLVIACRHLLELSEAETAAALDCRPGTVKSRLSRALERLRTEVGGDV